MSLVSKAGCVLVHFGLESGNDFIRNRIFKRDISKEHIITAAKNLRGKNIEFIVYAIIGSDEETKQSLNETFRLIKHIKPSIVSYNRYQPLPNTELSIRYKHGNILLELLEKSIKTGIRNIMWIAPRRCSSWCIKKMHLLLVVERLSHLFIKGIQLKNFGFFNFLLNCIFNFKNIRSASLLRPHIMLSELESQILTEYIFSKVKNN